MARLQRRSGYTLVESLGALLLMMLLLNVASSLLLVMAQQDGKTVEQEDVFRLQLKQLMIRSAFVTYGDESINIQYDNELFVIKRDRDRIVKTPGYEILLENVTTFNTQRGVVEVCTVRKCVEV